MALFTDSIITTLDQLSAQDTAVLNIANIEGIDATGKLTLAQNELGAELIAASSRAPFSSPNTSVWWPGVLTASTLQLSNVAVTQPLQMWHAFHTLELIYRDAYYNQLNDRYRERWGSYVELNKWASGLLWQTGIGMVADPVPIAESPHVTVTTGSRPASSYFVQVAWINGRNEEGAPSPVISAGAPNESSIEVTPVAAPANAAGWNLYVGASIDTVTLQNEFTLPMGAPWTLPGTGLITGRVPGTGQAPNYFKPIPRYLQRG